MGGVLHRYYSGDRNKCQYYERMLLNKLEFHKSMRDHGGIDFISYGPAWLPDGTWYRFYSQRNKDGFNTDVIEVNSPFIKEGRKKEELRNYVVGRYGAVWMSTDKYYASKTYFWGCEFPKGEVWVTLVGNDGDVSVDEGITMDMNDFGLVATVHTIYDTAGNNIVTVYASHDYGRSFKKLPNCIMPVYNDWIRTDIQIVNGIIYVLVFASIANTVTVYKYIAGNDTFEEGSWESVYSPSVIGNENDNSAVDFTAYQEDEQVKFMWSTIGGYGDHSLLLRKDGAEIYCGDDYPDPWPYASGDPGYGNFEGQSGIYRMFLDYPANTHNGDIYLLADTIQTKDLRYVTSSGDEGREVTCPFCGTTGYEDFAHAWVLFPYEYDQDCLDDGGTASECRLPFSEKCAHFRDYTNRPPFTVNPVEFSDDYTETAVIRDSCNTTVWTSRAYPPEVGDTDDYRVSLYHYSKNIFIEFDKNNTNTWVVSTSHLATNGRTPEDGNNAVLVSIDNGVTFSVVETSEPGQPWFTPGTTKGIYRCSEGAVLDGIVAWGHQYWDYYDYNRFVIYAGYLNKESMTVGWQTLFEDDRDKDYYGDSNYFIDFRAGNIKIVKGKTKEV